MNLIYLPEPRSKLSSFRRWSRLPNATIYPRRRYDGDELGRLAHFVLLIVFLLFAVRVGSVVPFLLHDSLGFEIAMDADGIQLPMAHSSRQIKYQRLQPPILIHANGVVKIGGQRTEPEQRVRRIREMKSWQPRSVAYLVVDTGSSMGVVLDVLADLRSAGVYEFSFATSKSEGRRF